MPLINYKFPTRFLHHCQRGFQSRYLSEYPWMVYSPSVHVDGVFCKHCALMTPMHCRKDKGTSVKSLSWTGINFKKRQKDIEQMKYHHDAMNATESFLTDTVENPEQNVNNRLDDEKRKNIIKKGTLLNVFQKPSFSVVDSALPCVEITKSWTVRVVGIQTTS